MEDPKPDKDMRPRFKKIEKVLAQAEDMANKFVAGACPRDLDPAISLPVARLLARVRLALAELRLMQVAGLVGGLEGWCLLVWVLVPCGRGCGRVLWGLRGWLCGRWACMGLWR